ncbi:MAG: DUF2846 domain-containing protein [Bryobacteraceae bacterium]
MKLFRGPMLAAAVLGSVLGTAAAAADKAKDQDKGESAEPTNKELELKACGPSDREVRFTAGTDKTKHPTAAPAPDKTIIYMLRPSLIGNKIQTKVAVDGQWKGVNRGDNYFFFTLDPGEHYFCSQSENHSLLTLKVEAGKTYYLQQHIHLGAMKARNKLELMTEEEGKAKLAHAHPSTWTIK